MKYYFERDRDNCVSYVHKNLAPVHEGVYRDEERICLRQI
jgi:hypothetical protein